MNLGYTLPGAKDLVLKGVKLHTIREDRTERWRAGMLIHHCTGNRTKHRDCFMVNKVMSVQQILLVIDKTGFLQITIDRHRIKGVQRLRFANNDGFESGAGILDMIDWFFPKGKDGKRKRTMFAGKIIHWTNLRY